jgi:signal transduction histidine kinase
MSDPDMVGYTGAVNRLRAAVLAGFGGIAAIFIAAGIDSIRLLNALRAENRVLREATEERSHHLASIRSYVLLCHTYMGDYFADSDQEQARQHWSQLEANWSRMMGDLTAYNASSLEDKMLMARLRALLDLHYRNMDFARRNRASYQEEMVPLRTSVLEISTRVEDVNARQTARLGTEMQDEFERMGRHLGFTLGLAAASAILLAVGCAVYILQLERQSRQRYLEIQRLSTRLLEAQEEERRSISRELHDQVGQTLSAVMVDAANLAGRIPPEDTISRGYLDNIRNLADSSVNSIRNIALLLRPSMLDDLGLIAALEWQAREVSRRTGINIQVKDENVPESLPDSVRTCVYRLVQEALSNISRHSGARNSTVSVRYADRELALTIEDDGSGFVPARTTGLGLLGMQERVKRLGGRIEVQSAPGKGTTIRASLPVSE